MKTGLLDTAKFSKFTYTGIRDAAREVHAQRTALAWLDGMPNATVSKQHRKQFIKFYGIDALKTVTDKWKENRRQMALARRDLRDG